jgi:hypothetical protein
MAVSARRHQIWRNAGTGDVPGAGRGNRSAAEHVKIVGRTRDWLRYEVPDHFIKREIRGHYRGQKQIWFLLRMCARDNDVNLRLTDHPEFDAWRWHDYWVRSMS